MTRSRATRLAFVVALSILTVTLGSASALLGACGPFTDAAADSFCPFVLEIFYLGITTGTTPTTYDPTATVTRLQMAAFLSRTVDGVLKRGSRRAALDQFWTTQGASSLGVTTVGPQPFFAATDGTDVWVPNTGNGTVSRVRASDGKLLETWTGVPIVFGVLPAMGRILLAGASDGMLYAIDPSQPAGAVTTVASNLGTNPGAIVFDGARVWTANFGGSVSIVTPGATIPWTVTTVATGFASLHGALFDGANVWVTDFTAGTLLKLDSAGAILQTVTVGSAPIVPVFDGANIWVPGDTTVTVVRASNGTVLQTLTGNGLDGARAAAFDGQRVLVTSFSAGVSLWKAADLTTIGTFSTGGGSPHPYGACSDGVNFWIVLNGLNQLVRF